MLVDQLCALAGLGNDVARFCNNLRSDIPCGDWKQELAEANCCTKRYGNLDEACVAMPIKSIEIPPVLSDAIVASSGVISVQEEHMARSLSVSTCPG